MTLSFKDVTEILKMIDASDCDEVLLEIEGTKLLIRRNGAGETNAAGIAPQTAPPALTAVEPEAETETASDEETPAPAATEPDEEEDVGDGLLALRAPMVGTFYRRPSPDEDPFVEVGKSVEAGDPLCLIEVMKLYTTIEAPENGIIERIAVEDGTLVEFNALLFLIRPE